MTSENNELAPVLECSQPAVINQNLMDVGANVRRIMERVGQLPKTRENVAEVKQIRAKLNKDIASWEIQRKTAKAVALAEYEQANKVYQDAVAGPLKQAEMLCKDFVDEVENAAKKKCEDSLREYYVELCQARGIFWLPFERLGIKVTLAMADQKEPRQAKKAIFDRLAKVDQDLQTISGMEDSADILTEYEHTLDLSTAISAVQNRKRAQEIAEENRAKWREVQDSRAQNTAYIAAQAPDAVRVVQQSQEKKFKTTFTVTATMPMLRGLKAFLDGRNYEYQEVTNDGRQ